MSWMILKTRHFHRWAKKAAFVLGFEKRDQANVSEKELEALKLLAGDLLALSAEQIAEAVSSGYLLEVVNETHES